MVGVDKYIMIHPCFRANCYTKPASRVSVSFLESTGRLRHDISQHARDIKKSIVSSVKLQQACMGKLHFILACPYTRKQASKPKKALRGLHRRS
jgi:hypothetical protein